jgi:dTDP-4-dehydrorhamnose reductase
MVCGGQTSRYEVANYLLQLLNIQNHIHTIPVNSDYFKKEYFAERPPNERLINKKLNLRGVNIMRDWKIALAEYLGEYYEGYIPSEQ